MANLPNPNDTYNQTYTRAFDQAISNTLYGLNYTWATPPLPAEDYSKGFVFFTRPQLNLSTANILNVRQFYPLLNDNPVSMQRYVRTMLDPRLQWYLTGSYTEKINPTVNKPIFSNEVLDSPLCDKYNPFIPPLSNLLLTLSGIPDVVVPHMTTTQGLRREQYAMVDGTYEVNDVYEVTATFRNIKSGVLPFMFQIWVMYMSHVFEGELSPYVDFILENEIDYNTRFYRIILDKTGRYVSQIFAPGAAFPISIPLGKYFDYNRNEIISEHSKTLDIRFVCMGGMYNDPILIREFNKTNAIFNPFYYSYYEFGMKDAMVEVDAVLLPYLNYRAYPYIDEDTYEFKWLVPSSSKLLKKVLDDLKKKDNELEELAEKIDVSKFASII